MRRIAPIALLLSLAVMSCARQAGGPGTSGIQGTILLGPTCPVVRSDSPCPDQPIAADVKVTDPSGGLKATVRSGADGAFRLALPPGTYVVTASTGNAIQLGKPVDVAVASGHFTTVTLLVDSGIR